MLLLYRILLFIIYIIIYIPARIAAARGSIKWRDRLCVGAFESNYDLWIHASSVGEVKVISYLIDHLQKTKPDIKIYLTVMTDAGYKMASKIKLINCTVAYFPLDCDQVMRRIIKNVLPQAVVIAETEIWPNLISLLYKRKIYIVQVNARMSDKAFGRYKFIKGLISKILSSYGRFFFKTEMDKERYQYFGVENSQAVVVGDMKFDAPLIPRSKGRINEIRHRAGVNEDDFVIVAGSTRNGEEKLLIREFINSKAASDKITKLIIAPRHIERIEEIKQICLDENIAYSIYGNDSQKASIILVDKMGILNDIYLVADLAFVGGTLVNIGGHNILEPVWAGTPVIFGPFLSNVVEAADYILQNNYGAKISSTDEIFKIISKMKSGKVAFNTKSTNDMSCSPTAIAGDYILSRLKNA